MCIYHLKAGDSGSCLVTGLRDIWVYCEYCGMEWLLQIEFDTHIMKVSNEGSPVRVINQKELEQLRNIGD